MSLNLVASKRVQVDEIWSFVGCKEKNRKAGKAGDGDAWTWCAIDADSKLIVPYLVGLRELDYALAFVRDVAARLKHRIQLTPDGLKLCVTAVLDAFSWDGVAGITDRVWKPEDLVEMLVAGEQQYKCHGRINRSDKR